MPRPGGEPTATLGHRGLELGPGGPVGRESLEIIGHVAHPTVQGRSQYRTVYRGLLDADSVALEANLLLAQDLVPTHSPLDGRLSVRPDTDGFSEYPISEIDGTTAGMVSLEVDLGGSVGGGTIWFIEQAEVFRMDGGDAEIERVTRQVAVVLEQRDRGITLRHVGVDADPSTGLFSILERIHLVDLTGDESKELVLVYSELASGRSCPYRQVRIVNFVSSCDRLVTIALQPGSHAAAEMRSETTVGHVTLGAHPSAEQIVLGDPLPTSIALEQIAFERDACTLRPHVTHSPFALRGGRQIVSWDGNESAPTFLIEDGQNQTATTDLPFEHHWQRLAFPNAVGPVCETWPAETVVSVAR